MSILNIIIVFYIWFIFALVERSASLGRALDWGSKGCLFEYHHRQSHYVVSLSKTLYPLLSTCTGSAKEDLLRHA